MIAVCDEILSAPPGQKTASVGVGLIGLKNQTPRPLNDAAPKGYAFPDGGYPPERPPIEELPEFVRRIEGLFPCCRAFNGSLCLFRDKWIFAYRVERYDGINRLALAFMDEGGEVLANQWLSMPDETGSDHWEDPRLCVVGGRLVLACAYVRFAPMTFCQQRMFWLDGRTFQPVEEVEGLNFGQNHGSGCIEKNWMPLELPDGALGLVYNQRPHVVVDVATRRGYTTPGLMGWRHGKLLSGRTPPLRVNPDYYFAFFGGHIKHALRWGRYFIGAHLFESKPPYRIIAATPDPIAWGSEASPTLYSSRPGSGYPLCHFPAGAAVLGNTIWMSSGINDSYNALFRYDLSKLIAGMRAVDMEGAWEGP